MQVVFVCVPGHGHLNPMVPLAGVLADRGCDVRFVTGRELSARVEQLGFRCVAAGPTLDEMQANALAAPAVRDALKTEPWVVAAAIFGGRAQLVMDDLERLDLSPDLVIHDAMEMAGPILGARHGVPWVTHGLGPRWPSLVEDAIPAFVDSTWDRHGLQPIARGGLGHHAYVEICPPIVRSDNRPAGGRTIECRPVALDEPRSAAVAFREGDRPKLYCTLGTFTNSNAEVFRTLIDTVGSLDVEALLTTGWSIDVHALGPLPSNVTVERYVPQAHVLGHVDAVVCHGGSGTMLAALSSGLPIVALPQGADQFINAPWWKQSGAVAVIEPADLDPTSLASGIMAALHSTGMHAAAEALARDIASMPAPGQIADELLALAEP